ncbi:uncharacterized protein LOC144630809 isoform X2 [Oculina patagonica]
MPPKKRPYPTRSNAKRARPRLSEMAETRPDKSKRHEVGQEEQPHMAVNLTALSASISVAVKQAVVEALGEKTQTVQSTTPASATEQSVVDEVVNVSLAGITQVPGRAFLRRLIDLTVGVRRPHHRIRLGKETKHDMEVWLKFLTDFNGRSFFLSDI